MILTAIIFLLVGVFVGVLISVLCTSAKIGDEMLSKINEEKNKIQKYKENE